MSYQPHKDSPGVKDPAAALEQLRVAFAEMLGEDRNTWPSHGNVVLAIAAAFTAQQAKIDALMLEYCPDEMTEHQRQQWEQHQMIAPSIETGAALRTK